MSNSRIECPNCGGATVVTPTGFIGVTVQCPVCCGIGFLVASTPDGDELRLSPEALAETMRSFEGFHSPAFKAGQMYGDSENAEAPQKDLDLTLLSDDELSAEVRARGAANKAACDRLAEALVEFRRRLEAARAD